MMTGDQREHKLEHDHTAGEEHDNNTTQEGDPPTDRKKRKIDDMEDSPVNPLHLTESEQQDTKPKKQQQPRLKPTAQVLTTRRMLQQCCRNNDLAKAIQVYHQANNEGTLVEAQSLYNLLNLCDGLGERPLHIGTPSQTKLESKNNDKRCDESNAPKSEQEEIPVVVDLEARQEFAFLIKKDMDDRNLPMNETAYTALIRILSKAMRLDEANQLLRQAEQTQQCKMRLRLYSSLLASYCQVDQMDRAIDLWVRLDAEKLALTEREYTAMIQCAARTGNAPMVERCLSELAEDVLIPSKDTVQALVHWFQSPHATIAVSDDEDGGHDSNCRSEIEPPPCHVPSMGPTVATTPWTIDSGCTIIDGVLLTGCLQGHVLQPVPLLQQACQEMIDFNETIVLQGMVDGHESSFQGGGKGPKRKVDFTARMRNWNGFKDFLVTNYKGGLDVVIDGANVGYYKQNFSHAPKHVDYRQIDTVVEHFAKLDKKILLVLHARHFSHQLMPEWARPIVNSWSSILYRANHGMNDDWFWLHAALWGNATVVTNDEMRDHHFQMLAPRSFLRWKERHQIHFCFEAVSGHRILKLTYPNKYSRRVQRIGDGLVVPLAKRGDENRFLDGVHVANEEEPEEETYLCICPRKC
ncbi:Protein-only RNase P [Fragilaria crotonensis]|nr:Protein-only RNase P [Fragilaria crotonensis]